MAVYAFFIVLYTQAGDRESVTRSSVKWSTPIFERANHFSNLFNFICSQLILYQNSDQYISWFTHFYPTKFTPYNSTNMFIEKNCILH